MIFLNDLKWPTSDLPRSPQLPAACCTVPGRDYSCTLSHTRSNLGRLSAVGTLPAWDDAVDEFAVRRAPSRCVHPRPMRLQPARSPCTPPSTAAGSVAGCPICPTSLERVLLHAAEISGAIGRTGESQVMPSCAHRTYPPSPWPPPSSQPARTKTRTQRRAHARPRRIRIMAAKTRAPWHHLCGVLRAFGTANIRHPCPHLSTAGGLDARADDVRRGRRVAATAAVRPTAKLRATAAHASVLCSARATAGINH